MKGIYVNIDGTRYTATVPISKLSGSYDETGRWYIYRDPTSTSLNETATRIVQAPVYGNVFLVEKRYRGCNIL